MRSQSLLFRVIVYFCSDECFHGEYGACFCGVGAAEGGVEMGQVLPLG